MILPSHKEEIFPRAKSWLTSHNLGQQRGPCARRRQEFLPEDREGPQLNRIQGRLCEACKACSKKGAQLGTVSFYSETGPAWGGGGRGRIKENPKASLNTFTNYKGKLMLASGVGANSGLSCLELNSTWKETLFFFPGKLKVGTERDCPLCGKNTQSIPV